MQTRSTLTAALVLCAGSLVVAQRIGPGQTPSFRSGVEVVTIDVNVIDKQGQPLRGLGPSDFVVTVAGQPRRVVTADFVDVAAAQPERVLRPGVVPVSTNEGGGVTAASLNGNRGLTVDLASGRLWVCDTSNNRVRLVDADLHP